MIESPRISELENHPESSKGSSLSPPTDSLKNTRLKTNPRSQSLIHLDSKEILIVKQGLNKFTKGLKFLKQIADKASKGSDKQQENSREKVSLSLTETEIPLSDCSLSPTNSNEEDKKPASEELKLVVLNKLENLERALADMNTFEEKIFKKVEDAIINKEQQILQTLDTKFEEYYSLLELRKKEIQEKIVSHFSEIRDKVQNKEYPHESQYEAKTKAIEWKNIVKNKIETWKIIQTIEVANNIIEEDESSMVPEIKLWMTRVENMLNMGNLETLVDKSFLVFDEEPKKSISSLSEFKIVLEEKEIFSKPRSSIYREKAEQEGSKSDESGSPDKMDKVTAVSKLFKAFQLKVDSADDEQVKLKPNHVLSLPSSVSKEKKKKQFMFENYEDVQRLEIHCEEFKDKHLSSLAETLEFLTSLKSLRIILQRCDQIRDVGLEMLGGVLGALPNLENLTFEHLSSSSKTTEEGLTKFMKQITQNSSIKTLSLSFDKLFNVSGKGWSQQWKELATMANLSHITTVVPANIELDDEDLFTIATNIKLMTKLEGFEITIQGNEKLTHKSFSYLSEALCKLLSLHTLKISFKEDTGSFNDRSFSSLTYPLSKLMMLKSLTLDFPKCYISQEKFVEFTASLSKLSHLKQLSLNFSWSLIGDKSLEELAKALPFLLYLTNLRIDFTACSITNKGFISLITALSGLFNLTSLAFDLSWCKELTDEGIDHLGQTISKLNNLKNLELSFREVKKITESDILKFCGLVSRFNNIEDLMLDLGNCGRDITEESQSKIEEALSTGRREIKSQIFIT